MTDWVEKNSGILLTWFGSLFVVASGMYWRLKQSEKDLVLLQTEINTLKSDLQKSARINDVDNKLEKLEEHLTRQILKVEADIKTQNDVAREFNNKISDTFAAIRKEMSDGFNNLNTTILKLVRPE